MQAPPPNAQGPAQPPAAAPPPSAFDAELQQRTEEQQQQPSEEEMVATERDLAEDAQWKRIQQNTFTRWANEHLKTVNKHIGNLESDLSDGLRLISLIEVLSGKKLPKHNKRPNFRSQKLENVSVALRFLEEDEGIRIVNIDSSDIVDCKLKLILGLIWTLILHYSISIPMWEGEDFFHGDKAGPTPKQRLLGWIQSKIPDLPITNFTSDWNDGRAVGALVDALAPGLCPDWPDWNPKNNLQNAREAMTLADNWLGVPQLVKPEEMVNPNVDELSMMTYLSQYPAAKLKPNAPLRPRINPNRVRAYGPGIEPTGVVVGAPANFTVETFSAGKGNVEVAVLNPQGQAEPVDVKFNNDRNLTYSVTYKPRLEGAHKVSVKFTGKEIPKSPYSVMVEGHAGDPSKVTASGPGLEPTGVTVGKPTYFDIITKGAGRGVVEVIILDPQGNKNTVPTKVRHVEGDLWRCEYMPVASGLHSVNVFFAGQPIPSSPYGVKISPVCDARRVRASGRGLQPTGVRVKDAADFRVFTDGSGEGNVEVKVIGPGGQQEKVDVKVLPDGTTYDCVYHPQKEGRYVVMISFGGKEIARSPFEVAVGPYKESSIRAYGPGLHGGVVGYPALFTVETNGETGALGFSIEGPSQARIECNDNGDGSADVKYHPTAPGEYAVHILCNNEDIPKSPYMAQVIPKTDYFPEKVKAFGPGLEKSGVQLGKPTEFTVDTRASGGHAPLDIKVMDEDYNPVELKVVDNKDGTFKCFYTPKRPVKHTVQVHFGGVAVNESPFRVYVSAPTDAKNVKVFGPGVEKGVKSQTPTHFNIDCREAGPGDVQVGISSDVTKQQLPFSIQDNDNGTFTVDYTPTNAGDHKVNVFFANKEIPQSPIKVTVQPHLDVSKVKVLGLEPSMYVDSTTDITVDATAITHKSDAKVVCTINNPSGNKTDAVVQPMNDGTYKVTFTPFEEGRHTVDVTYDGVPVPGSPFPVTMKKGCDPRKCRAFGPGLERGITHRSNQFTVETKGAGTGGLGLAIEGPSESKITCKDNGNGSCSVDYLPTEAGEYDISIKFADQHIPGSPFKVPVDNSVDASRVEAFGPGLEPEHCRANVPLKFVVDSTKSGKAPLAVQVTSEKGPVSRKPDIEDKKDGTHEVTYYAPPEGSKCNVKVTYDGKDIPKSPYQMKVKPTVEPNKVKVSGPGVGGGAKGVPASIPVDFTIDTRDAGFGDLQITVLGPDGQPKKVKVSDNNDGTFKATYVPDDVGPYKVDVKYAGKEVPNSPFTVNAVPTGAADKCKITEGVRQTTVIGEESCISVNAKQAGDGKVTCRVRSTSGTGSDLDIDIQDNKDGTFSIYYTCKETGEYTISVKFGGQPVPGGVYTFRAETQEISQVSKRTTTTTTTTRTTTLIGEDHTQQQAVQGLQGAPLTSAQPQSAAPGSKFNPVVLNQIPVPTATGRITAEVKMPSGGVDRAVIVDNHDGTVSVKYEPREEGLHELHIKYNHEHVHGSPFKFHVDTLSSGYVTAYGPGLVHGVCGEPCNFTITTKDAGAGGLSLAVEGPSKADITCHDNKDGTVSVSYLPTAPGEYKASVKFADKHIKGSPFTAKITGEGRKRNQISVGSSSEVSLNVKEEDIRNLSATIRAPSGLEEPVFVKKLPNGNLGISFTPREVGEHDVSVKRLGKHIPKSPFKITVGDREVGDAKKVRVYGNALREGKTHTDNHFTIDTKAAGYGGLSLSIEGPSKADISCKDNDDGTLTVGYKPTEPGYYIVNLKFADHHVHGSPFTVKVTGEGSNRQTERIKKEREAVPITEVGSNCRLTFKLPGVSPFDLTAAVASPSGVTEDAEINDIDEYVYAVNFVPKELGVHTVSVRYKDIHIPGSPFQFTVGPLRDFGAHRVHAGGNGLERGEVKVPSDFNVWTHEAGAGSLAISVEGPSKAEIDFKDRKDGSCYVSYVVTEPGEYRVGVKFNDQHIPDSPFKVYIMPDLGEARKVEVLNMPDTVPVDKPFAFIVNQNGAKGTLDAKAIAPSGVEDDCFLSPLDLDQWALRFVPRENGVHTIHIKFNGVHIPGSPFRIRIGKDDSDPAAVHAVGNGLKDVKTGQKTDFIVDTCNAGSGTLAVTIDGPSKVSMDCTEVEEGYKVRYTPLAPGDYYVTIKYNSCHIAGSPYKIRCTGDAVAEVGTQETSSVVVETVQKQSKIRQSQQNMPKFHSDASKVSCKGMGLKKAYLHKQNTFTVHTEGAGDNMLFCNLHGPKNPTEEVFIKHVGHNNYQVNYQIKDRGEYVLVVKWGEDHIPGSPFRVEVA